MKASNLLISQFVSLLLMILLLFSCNQNQFESKTDLLVFIQNEENGFIQQKSVNGYDFKLMYRPTDLLVLQEIANTEPTEERVNQLKNKYNKQIYFNLSISKNNQELLSVTPKNRNEFGAMVNQLAFGMREKVHLFTQIKDTIKMIDFVYPRMYGMGRSTNIMLVYPFEEEKLKQEHLYFTIQDLGLDTGEIKFKIETNKIKNEPYLLF